VTEPLPEDKRCGQPVHLRTSAHKLAETTAKSWEVVFSETGFFALRGGRLPRSENLDHQTEGWFFSVTQRPDSGSEPGGSVNLYQGNTTLGNPLDSPRNSIPSYSQQRTVPRYTFVATADLTDAASAMKLPGRVAEISRKGCYVDTLNTLPVGTLLDVRISREQGTFVTKGKTIYVQERLGMGVVFLEPKEDQLRILDSWLAVLPATARL
jgi:PilZ domain-containing protein